MPGHYGRYEVARSDEKGAGPVGMEIRLTFSLPRDRSTVPLTRRVLDAALGVFSVTRDCRDDIGLAVGEACANAVQHADLGLDYQVTVTIHEDRCVIDVVDEGVGMEAAPRPAAQRRRRARRSVSTPRAAAGCGSSTRSPTWWSSAGTNPTGWRCGS